MQGVVGREHVRFARQELLLLLLLLLLQDMRHAGVHRGQRGVGFYGLPGVGMLAIQDKRGM